MIRNLKVLVVAAMALTALGAAGASNAQAAQFHCSVEPCTVTMKPDGTGKTAHHVYIIKDSEGSTFSTTCTSVTGEGTLNVKTSNELTLGNIQGAGCEIWGQFSKLTSNGCHYVLGAEGTFSIKCPAGKMIENMGIECSYDMPEQGPLPGVKYTNSGSEVTAQINVSLTVIIGGPACPLKTGSGKAEITTGNILLTSETHAGVMANLWWE